MSILLSALKFFEYRYRIVLILLCAVVLLACSEQEQVVVDIPLQSLAGDVHLSDFKDQLILLSFGYTHCPDVCPATLLHVSQALNLLSNAERKKVQSIFFSVDPQRDTPQLLNEYVRYFHDDVIAVSAEGVNRTNFFKAFNIESHQQSNDLNDEISHTSFLFLIGSDAKVLDMMGHETAAKSIVMAIRKHMKVQ